jgi:hypothetical protein
MYFSCIGNNCSGTTVSLANQVQNPVDLLNDGTHNDTQGVVMDMTVHAVTATSPSPTVTGTLTFGFSANPTTIGANAIYRAEQAGMYGEFNTIFNGQTLASSFIDSGSNALFYPSIAAQTPLCDSQGFLCPPVGTPASYTASNYGFNDAGPGTNVSFQINNAEAMFNTGDRVLPNLGVDIEQSGATFVGAFDWGFPFFYNKKIWVGTNGGTTYADVQGSPFWAY